MVVVALRRRLPTTAKTGTIRRPVRLLYKRCGEAAKHFNAELTQNSQDRNFHFQQQKMFHSYGKDTDNLTKWEFYSNDDDVLLWVEGDYILANIEEIVEMRQAPTDKIDLGVS